MTALDQARAAADRAGVEIRELAPRETVEAAQLLTSIWGTPAVEPPLMIALRHSGAYVAGAFSAGHEAPGRMLGVCVGYFAEPLGESLHSHVAGVAPGAERRGIGIAMKLHQREWAVERGLASITWTFDPLVSRNAAFNIQRLGVEVDEYLVDFYGAMSDGVNAGQGSDRLYVRWHVSEPQASAPAPAARASALTTDHEGDPRPLIPDPSADAIAVAVPPDIEALRASDAAQAARWRGAVRGAMVPLLERGWRVTGFHDHHYLLGRP